MYHILTIILMSFGLAFGGTLDDYHENRNLLVKLSKPVHAAHTVANRRPVHQRTSAVDQRKKLTQRKEATPNPRSRAQTKRTLPKPVATKAILHCKSGYYLNAYRNRCQLCPAGKYSYLSPLSQYNDNTKNVSIIKQDGGVCKDCLAGKFSPRDGLTECEICPFNHTSTDGSQYCTNLDCPMQLYSNIDDHEKGFSQCKFDEPQFVLHHLKEGEGEGGGDHHLVRISAAPKSGTTWFDSLFILLGLSSKMNTTEIFNTDGKAEFVTITNLNGTKLIFDISGKSKHLIPYLDESCSMRRDVHTQAGFPDRLPCVWSSIPEGERDSDENKYCLPFKCDLQTSMPFPQFVLPSKYTFIVLLRDPRDVSLSACFHLKRPGCRQKSDHKNNPFPFFKAKLGLYASWIGARYSWHKQMLRENTLFVTYEGLRLRNREFLVQIVEKFNLDKTRININLVAKALTSYAQRSIMIKEQKTKNEEGMFPDLLKFAATLPDSILDGDGDLSMSENVTFPERNISSGSERRRLFNTRTGGNSTWRNNNALRNQNKSINDIMRGNLPEELIELWLDNDHWNPPPLFV